MARGVGRWAAGAVGLASGLGTRPGTGKTPVWPDTVQGAGRSKSPTGARTVLRSAPLKAASAAALKVYEQSHEAAACFVYRYNPAAMRVKIIDPTFHGRSKGERHDYVWGFLQGIPEDILAQISVLLCLEPDESVPLDVEFHEPTRSYL